jgi:hypothetical protein
MASRSKKKKQRQAQKDQLFPKLADMMLAFSHASENWGEPDPEDPKWVSVLSKVQEDFSLFDEITKRRLLSAVRTNMKKNAASEKTRQWTEDASYDQLMVAFHEGLSEAGQDPREFAESLYPSISGYDGYGHYVDVVSVQFANSDTPISMFPVFEIKCAYGVPEVPGTLVMDMTPSEGSGEEDLVDVTFRDPNSPRDARPFYVGHMGFSDSLKEFDRLRQIWGHFFLRVSFDVACVDQINKGVRPSTNTGFHPPSGVYYRDYIVFDNNASRRSQRKASPVVPVPNGAHRLIEDLVYRASTQGPRKFVEEGVKRVGWMDSEGDLAACKKLYKSFFLNPMLHISGTKLPWKLKEEHSFRSKNKKLMLKHLFRVIDDMKEKELSSDTEEDRNEYAQIHAALKKARSYEFTPAAYHRVFRACEEYVMKDSLGFDFASSEEFHTQFQDGDAYGILDAISVEAQSVPFPERLPFECCYFGWGAGVEIDVYNRASFASSAAQSGLDLDEDVDVMVLLGHLVMETGDVISFYDLYMNKVEDVGVVVSHDRKAKDEQWAVGTNLVPWMIVTVAGEILSHAVVEERDLSSSEARKYKRLGKKDGVKKPIPPPYYTVYVRDKHIKKRIRKASTGVGSKQSYRHDVEGHPRLLYKLGKLPIEDKVRKKLEKAEYTIYPHGTPIPADHQAMMMERGRDFPKRGEWVALRKVFIEPFISPRNPDLPYVPAVRKTTKGVSSANYKEEDDE